LIDPQLVTDLVGLAGLLTSLLVQRVWREAPVIGLARSLP